MEIIWLTIIRLNHMNKEHCRDIVIVLTRVGDSWDKLLGLLKMKVVITIAKTCMTVVSWLRKFNFDKFCKHSLWQWKTMWSLKNITPHVVMNMSHWPLAKILSFMTYLEDGTKVIGVHTHRIEPHTTEKAPMNHKYVNRVRWRRNEGVKDIVCY